MQSISAPSIHILPIDNKDSDESDYDVLHLEKLLNKIFGEELDKALAIESESQESSIQESSNLIEFPLMRELIALEYESAGKGETLDFSPEAFGLDDPVLETDLTRFTPSIIERDDFDAGHLQAVIDAQQEQLGSLRGELKQKDILIRSQAIDLASKDDQLKYLPEFFNKALKLANVETTNLILTNDLTVEKLVNEELNCELANTKSELVALNSHLLVKFARVLGVIS
jgi:hypothetical protein